MDQLYKFLFTGSLSGVVSLVPLPPKLEECKFIETLIDDGDGLIVVDIITNLWTNNDCPLPRTLKKYSIFALAFCCRATTNTKVKHAAYEALPKICTQSDELFRFVQHSNSFGSTTGWGRAHRRAISKWFNGRDSLELSALVTESVESRGWRHKDIIKLGHIKPKSNAINAIFAYLMRGIPGLKEQCEGVEENSEIDKVQKYLLAVHDAKHDEDKQRVAALIEEYKLKPSQVSTKHLKSPEIWKALVCNMSLVDILGMLPKLVELGILKSDHDFSNLDFLLQRFTDEEEIKKEGIHPITVLTAQMVYQCKTSKKIATPWTPLKDVINALNTMMNIAYSNIKLEKHVLLAAHLSSTKSESSVLGSSFISPRLAVSATNRVFSQSTGSCTLLSYSENGVEHVDTSGSESLTMNLDSILQVSSESTNPSLAIKWAMDQKDDTGKIYDSFIIMTNMDNLIETDEIDKTIQDYKQKNEMDQVRVVLWNIGGVNNSIIKDTTTFLQPVGFNDKLFPVIERFVNYRL